MKRFRRDHIEAATNEVPMTLSFGGEIPVFSIEGPLTPKRQEILDRWRDFQGKQDRTLVIVYPH